MTEPVTAYLTHRPWSAADGGKLFGSIRVIEHTGAPTGMVHRFEIRDRASAGDRTKSGRLCVRGDDTRKAAPRWSEQHEASMRTTHGWLERVSGSFLKRDKGAERNFVKLRCRCGGEFDVQRTKWLSKYAPNTCASGKCIYAYRSANPKQKANTEQREAA